MAQLYLAAAHKSSGKTTLAVGLAAALRGDGKVVQTFKKGPDYIDPMWLSRASGRPCFNLDFHTQTNQEILGSAAARARDADIALIEGNKGLFDGLDVEGADSNAALAKLLGAPVVLVIDCEGMTRGVAPLIQGYQNFDDEVAIAGVILNQVGGARHEAKLTAALERYTDVAVFGALHRDPELAVPERHLGLTTPGETLALDDKIAAIAGRVSDSVDLAALVAAAGQAQPVAAGEAGGARVPRAADLRIAIPRDEAFGFYYPDDLEALAVNGAELVFFDTLRDQALPAADGLFLGGGFPETQMRGLEANAPMRASIRAALAAGLPAYAECGGLMYLCRRLVWGEERAEMVGVIDGDAVMHARPQGRGFVRLEETVHFPWPGPGAAREIAAHEFHYAGIEGLSEDSAFGYAVRRGAGLDGTHDGLVIGNLLASFSHLRDTQANHWTARFTAFVRDCKAHADSAA